MKNPAPAQSPSLPERRYDDEGRVFLSGVHSLVRLPIEQMRRDAIAGLRTKCLITGYPGSPLGGYDIALQQARSHLTKYGITHRPAQNEDMAVATLTGTQMLDKHPHPDVDGVVGFWYGKGPGIDRSGDALKHGNFAGTSKHGAVVILSGEDHEAKSSSVPYQQEFAFEHFGIPVLYPSSVSEFLSFGLHAVALSRYSGCWVSLKLVAPLCDGGEVVDTNALNNPIVIPDLELNGKPFAKRADFTFFPVVNVGTERELYEERHEAVNAYVAANELNKIVVSTPNDKIGIISAGKSYSDMRQALLDLELDEAGLNARGIRIAKVGVLCPNAPGFFQTFAAGLQKIIVIEEKRDFLERQIGHALCGLVPIEIFGKRNAEGRSLFPVAGGFDVDVVAERLQQELSRYVALPDQAKIRVEQIKRARGTAVPVLPRRTPNYCSGCPHNVSTKLAPGQQAWGAPGCHVFAALIEAPERRIQALSHFGGEGLAWIGLSPYTSRKHIVQNIGDGSLFHSSLQNIRYAVTSRQRMTYRILFNGVVANTGGQEPVSDASVLTLLKRLEMDGVAKTVLVAKEPQVYRGQRLPGNIEIREPHEVQAAMAQLAEIDGVTVLLYDGSCANERRRRQKRGKVPKPTTFTVVNEEVCENCGDCGRKANCMSLQKIETEFGPKTQIHQSSCNQDQACIEGECPSFVSIKVDAGTGVAKPIAAEFSEDLPEPTRPALDRPYCIYLPGVGGTGVITVNAILAEAAALDGVDVRSFDQTGAAQKWGAVLSSLIVSERGERNFSNRVTAENADLYLALDLMGAADRTNLGVCRHDRTVAVINTDILPTGEMIRNTQLVVSAGDLTQAVLERVNKASSIFLPARTAVERIFGDYMMANMVIVGAAYQAGLMPISAQSIERAISLNGVAVQTNIKAFRIGRLSQHDPSAFARLAGGPALTLADRFAGADLGKTDHVRGLTELLRSLPASVADAARMRALDLVSYQGKHYAERYVELVSGFFAEEREALPKHSAALTELVVKNVYKLMAYKDEYEVARLLTNPTFQTRVRKLFPGFRSMQFNLQPPFARSFGLTRKVRLGAWFRVPLRILSHLKVLRGTWLDPFGYGGSRREERALIDWYLDIVGFCAAQLSIGQEDKLADLLRLPESIRGYEQVRHDAIVAAKLRAIQIRQQVQAAQLKAVA